MSYNTSHMGLNHQVSGPHFDKIRSILILYLQFNLFI